MPARTSGEVVRIPPGLSFRMLVTVKGRYTPLVKSLTPYALEQYQVDSVTLVIRYCLAVGF